jgi:hypothetical protein
MYIPGARLAKAGIGINNTDVDTCCIRPLSSATLVQLGLATQLHIVTTACGSGRVHHVRLSVHGLKTDSS